MPQGLKHNRRKRDGHTVPLSNTVRFHCARSNENVQSRTGHVLAVNPESGQMKMPWCRWRRRRYNSYISALGLVNMTKMPGTALFAFSAQQHRRWPTGRSLKGMCCRHSRILPNTLTCVELTLSLYPPWRWATRLVSQTWVYRGFLQLVSHTMLSKTRVKHDLRYSASQVNLR